MKDIFIRCTINTNDGHKVSLTEMINADTPHPEEIVIDEFIARFSKELRTALLAGVNQPREESGE